jgi:small subunit ribosomal protein S20
MDIIQLFWYTHGMPITKQALKKLRHDRVRTKQTGKIRESLRKVIKAARMTPNKKSLTTAFRALDKAANKHIIHKNKASRLKSRLAKLIKR